VKFILNYIHNLNYKLGISLFNNSNFFSNNIYNKFYKRNICNLESLKHEFINNYFKNGYAKLGKINQHTIYKVNEHLRLQNPKKNENDPQFKYKITPEIYEIISNILNNELKDKLDIIEEYYNQKIILAYLAITRNYNSNTEKESFSNFFHTDGYVYNMFKIFIKVHEVKDDNGPLTLVKKNSAKKFIKKMSYQNRYSYDRLNENKYKDYLFKNIGQAGEALMCSTTELIHRAGDPIEGKHRDMISLHFVALPTNDKILISEYKDSILNDKLIIKISKIKGVRKLIEYYKENLKTKLKKN
tara:strand:- start:244 stop:1143 length:900 start_codon:yes stop_codon:yes gene_type:complete